MLLPITDTRMLILMEDCQRRKILKTEKEFCEEVGFLHTNLAKIKKGRRSFTVAQLAAAGECFAVDMNWLYGFKHTVSHLPIYRKVASNGGSNNLECRDK